MYAIHGTAFAQAIAADAPCLPAVPERVAPFPILYGWQGQNWGFHIVLPEVRR